MKSALTIIAYLLAVVGVFVLAGECDTDSISTTIIVKSSALAMCLLGGYAVRRLEKI